MDQILSHWIDNYVYLDLDKTKSVAAFRFLPYKRAVLFQQEGPYCPVKLQAELSVRENFIFFCVRVDSLSPHWTIFATFSCGTCLQANMN